MRDLKNHNRPILEKKYSVDVIRSSYTRVFRLLKCTLEIKYREVLCLRTLL